MIGSGSIRGIRITTNIENYGVFGRTPGSDPGSDSYIIEGFGIKRITYEGTMTALYSMQFDFKEC